MEGTESRNPLQMRSLLVVFSYHHKNTEKIANAIGKVLEAQIRTPQQIRHEELQEYDLVGFGSGIYDGKHHQLLLDLADQQPKVTNRKAFLFSTCGVPAFGMTKELMAKNHSPLREKLLSKGYLIVDEFGCVGLNTNSFLTLLGGINKGRPNAEDLKHAGEFAQKLSQ
ncbi:MAG: flavodoxin family protein [Coprothermobacterota bacterium]|nr:flavodoxin family protein [Coprothermobacterota bacterium]